MSCLVVLVMSRHDPVRGWLSDAMRVLGYSRVVTSSESEALRAVQIVWADVAVVDSFLLPGSDASRFIASLRKVSANQALPTAVVVGPSHPVAVFDRLARSTCQAYVRWPVSLQSLADAISHLTHQPKERCHSQSEHSAPPGMLKYQPSNNPDAHAPDQSNSNVEP